MCNGVKADCGSARCGRAVESSTRRLPGGRLWQTGPRSRGCCVSFLGLVLLAGLVAPASRLAATNVEYACEVDGRALQQWQSSSGRAADFSGHPWHVALYQGGSFFCNGVLLGAEWVLTTAGCAAGGPGLAVGYGEGHLLDHGTAERHAVVERTYAPTCDLVLLRLGKPVMHARNSYANLPKEDETGALEGIGTCAVVTGWRTDGVRLEYRDLSAYEGLTAVVEGGARSEGPYAGALQAYDGEICAAGTDRGEICVSAANDAACLAGGAVTVGGSFNRPRWLVGIVSPDGGACGDGGLRTGFDHVKRVAHHREWMAKVMNRLGERESTRELEWRSPLGIEFVWIPAGSFMMGSPEDEEGRKSNERQHEVRISQGFWMGKYEVTQGEWASVMGKGQGLNDTYDMCLRCPVSYVTWHEAQEFIGILNAMESGRGYRYRLPSEAEWEYAARAGMTGGESETGWWDSALWRDVHILRWKRVDRSPGNAWGLHGMLMSVDEWTADWYGQYPLVAVTDPLGPDEGVDRVLRGSFWPRGRQRSGDTRPAGRAPFSPDESYKEIGFRLVRTE